MEEANKRTKYLKKENEGLKKDVAMSNEDIASLAEQVNNLELLKEDRHMWRAGGYQGKG